MQPSITAIIYARNATNPENFAKISGILSEIISLEPIVQPETVWVVRVIQGTYDFLFDFQSNYIIYAYLMPFRRYSVTKKGADPVNKNWLPMRDNVP